MPNDQDRLPTRVPIPVRSGPYQYVQVAPDGASSTIRVSPGAIEAGTAEIAVKPGDRIVEVALSSTSDPDLDPPLGQLWPVEGAS